MSWYIAALRKYAVFRGRARRKEYWIFQLIRYTFFIAGLLLYPLFERLPASVEEQFGDIYLLILYTYYAAMLLPELAVTIRRLHDTGRSGWWYLISLVPYIGAVVLFIFVLQDSQYGENEYGPNPKDMEGSRQWSSQPNMGV